MRTMSRSEPLPAGTLVGVFRSLSQRVEAADDWRSLPLMPVFMFEWDAGLFYPISHIILWCVIVARLE